jgi:surfeit locus 1 family protein
MKQLLKNFLVSLCLIVPFSLGIWQIYRLQIKTELIAKIRNHIDSPAVEIMEFITQKEEFIPVKFKCKNAHNKHILLYNSEIYQGKTGFSLITACKLENNKIILVDRGFVLQDLNEPLEEDIIGVIIFPRNPGYFIPKNDLEKNIWFSINLPESEKFLDLKLENFYVKMIDESKIFPIREKFNPHVPNNHLGYAVTWFSLAGIIMLILYFQTRRISNR